MAHIILCFFYSLCITMLYANETIQEEIKSFSKYIGYKSGMDLQGINGFYNLDSVIKGLKKGEHDVKQKSSVNDDEKLKTILEIQNFLFEKKSLENLTKAEKFLDDISKNSASVKVIEKKLCYEILKTGAGTKKVLVNSSPVFRYKILVMNGSTIVNELNEKEPSHVNLETTIPGFQKGTIGMKQGEQRKLYIHPDLAYRKTGSFPPNSLIIIDVEAMELE